MATIIQIKRSANVSAPTTSDLVEGELAYSQDKSNSGAGAKLYIESLDSGNSPVIHAIGGKYYTDIVDGATDANTAGKLVKRDASGNFSANVITANEFNGNINGQADSAVIANTANALTTGRYINLSGDVVGSAYFDGTGNADISAIVIQANAVALGTDTTGDYVANVLAGTGINVTGQGGETATPTVALSNTAVTPSTYGGSTQIPVFTVDAQGRLTAASNTAISTSITVFGDTGTDDLSTGQAIQFDGGTGIGTAVTADGSNTVVTVSIAASGVVANTYGGTTAIPVFTVDATGRITSASNTAISTSFTAAADAGSSQTISGGDTLTIAGGNGISTTASATDTITVDLEASGVSAGTYGGAATQTVVTVDTYGRVTSASNVTTQIALGTNTTGAYVANLVAGTGITLSGLGDEGTTPTITNAGVTSLASGGYGLSVDTSTGAVTVTNTGVTRAIAGTGISLDTNNGNVTFTNAGVTQLTGTANEVNVSGSTGSITIGLPDDVTITRDLTVAGNLYVTGNVVALPVENLVVEDSLIQLANNNISADLIDIGFYGSYNVGGGEHEHAGLFRDASDGKFKLFQGLQGQDNLTSTINITGTGYSVATLVADLLASNANVTTALSFGSEKNQILPLSSSILEIRGGLGDASGALSLAAGNYPTAYSKIYLESGKKITMQADELYVTLFNDGNTKLLTMNTTHTTAVSTTTGALRVAGGVGITGNIYASYFNGSIDCGTY